MAFKFCVETAAIAKNKQVFCVACWRLCGQKLGNVSVRHVSSTAALGKDGHKEAE